ncbi:MAG TPA: molybdopterin-dependent oxidoreductase, partial [Acidimicrobiia bacterium]|nr:molybdopterin-dependent oxidoreductase [Acidimicrobiia bacterium]
MTTKTSETVTPYEPTDGPLHVEELQLAFRNRGMPLEAMQYDLTPTGLHYLVARWDVPRIDPENWRLTIGGEVRTSLELSLDDIHALPRKTIPVTLECAGNGRGWLNPRPVSLPWLGEAIGTAEWTGIPLSELLEQADLHPDVVEVVFWGSDRGVMGGEEQTYARSLTLVEALRPEVMLAYEMNGRPLEPQHGFPLRLVVPGWYGMTSVKWLSAIEAV